MPWSEKANRFYPTLRDQPERFWAKVDVRSPMWCWEWLGCRTQSGYGRAGKAEYSHRLAYELSVGPIPTGAFVLHSCDNPPCCNPDHLFLGDAAANARDMAAKGRARGGGPIRLDVEKAKSLLSKGHSLREIGRQMGFSHGSVAKAIRTRG